MRFALLSKMARHSGISSWSLLLLSVSVCSTVTVSCVSQRVGNEEQHTVGDVFHDKNRNLKGCNKARVASAAKAFPLTSQYLKFMTNHILKSVRKSLDAEDSTVLNANRICVVVVTGANQFSEMNAKAFPETGDIELNAGLILGVESDAQFAALLSHEMAHITLNHIGLFPQHTFKKLDAKSKATGAALQKVREKLSFARTNLVSSFRQLSVGVPLALSDLFMEQSASGRKLDAAKVIAKHITGSGACNFSCQAFIQAMAKYDTLVDESRTLRTQLLESAQNLYTKEELSNKAELDADEVGFEFFARSGFELSEYKFSYLALLKAKIGNTSGCMAENLQTVERGEKVHPSNCFRIHHGQSELESHKAKYSKWSKGIVNFENGEKPTLSQVKAELRSGGTASVSIPAM